MAIHNEIKTEEGKSVLVLTITNGHKETIENLVKEYRIKDGDEAKLIAFLLQVAEHEDVVGKPLGTVGKVFTPPEQWIET